MLAQEAVLDDLVHHALVEARRVQVGSLFGLQQLGIQKPGRHQVAHPQARRQHLGERSQVDRRITGPRGQGRRRRLIEPQVTVGVVFDDGQAECRRFIHQFETPRRTQATAAGVLEVRQQIDEARTACRLQLLG